jgi:hypothetical protein
VTHGYVINEDNGDRWEWHECEADDDCIVLHRAMWTGSGHVQEHEDCDKHIPRRCLEAIAAALREGER